MENLNKLFRNRYLLLMDVLLSVLAYAIVIILMFPVASFGAYFIDSLPSIALTVCVFASILFIFDMYNVYWMYASIKEYLKLLTACVTAGTVSMFVDIFLLHGALIYPKFCLAAKFAVMFLILALRFSIRVLQKLSNVSADKEGKRVLVIGAGQLCAMLLRDIRDNKRLHYNVVGLIDDDKVKKNQVMCGAKVLGGRSEIERICREKMVEEIVFAIYTLPLSEKKEILEICTKTGCKVKVMPGIEAVLSGNFGFDSMRNIEIEDLLEREPVKFDNNLIKEDLCGKTVLVTGGGGSIGSELCRQIIPFRPKLLIILDIYENTTYELQNELMEKYPDQQLEVLIASVRDKKRLDDIFSVYRPEIVFHAAAHKHVPLMEYSPCEAVKNNVFGTLNVAKCADEFGVRRFVMISTDKAVNPTNVMGATKRMCEMIIQTMAAESKTEFVAVRFGNVLGSNGSVIPRFKKQIAAGGPVTVTHPEITRFFMTIPEAARLVIQAAVNAQGGEIFVLDMGEPVKIYDLARKMIRLAGFQPEEDIKIEFTGLRPGEKLYEELLMNEEGLRKTEHSKIFIGSPIAINHNELQHKLQILSIALNKGSDAIKEALKEVVPTFVPEQAQEEYESEQDYAVLSNTATVVAS